MTNGDSEQNLQELFDTIYAQDRWGRHADGLAYSGPGSHVEAFIWPYIEAVRGILENLDQPVVVDLGCGDFNIGKNLLPHSSAYVACDVSQVILDQNRKYYQDDKLEFRHLNIVEDELPTGDIAFVRQVLQHLDNASIGKFVDSLNVTKPCRHLLITEHVPADPAFAANLDMPTGADIRVLTGSGVELDKAPFNLEFINKQVIIDIPSNVGPFEALIRTTLFSF